MEKGPVTGDRSDGVLADEPPERPTKRARPNPQAGQSNSRSMRSRSAAQSMAVVIHQAEEDQMHEPGRPQTRSAKQKLGLQETGDNDHTGEISPAGSHPVRSRRESSKAKAPQSPQRASISPTSATSSSPLVRNSEESTHDDGLESLSEDFESESDSEGLSDSSEEEYNPFSMVPLDTIHHEFLDGMVKTAERVGHRYDKRTDGYEPVLPRLDLRTNLAKKLYRVLKRLNAAYRSLPDAKASGDSSAISAIERKIYGYIGDSGEIIGEILDALPENASSRARYPLVMPRLVDIYFNILPMLLRCTKLGAEAGDEDGQIRLADLKELSRLVKLYLRLGNAAVNMPTVLQPTHGDCLGGIKSRSPRFEVRQPTREALSQAQSFQKILMAKISGMKGMAKDAKMSKLASRRKEGHREAELSKEERRLYNLEKSEQHWSEEEAHLIRKNRRLINENNRLQREAVDRQLSISQLRRRANINRRLEKASSDEGRIRRPVSQYDGSNEYDDEDHSDPFADDYSARIDVFPSNNIRCKPPVEWSNSQKITFIECMRLEKGIL